MNAKTFADWLRAQGTTVIRTPSSYWEHMGMGVYQAFPYQRLIQPEPGELDGLFSQHGVMAARYSLPLDAPVGMTSYHIVYDASSYDYEQLGHRTRKNVRRGLRNCDVVPLSLQQLVEKGWDVRADTLSRQGRGSPYTERSWKHRFRTAFGLPGFEAWGAMVNGGLAAFMVTFTMERCCFTLEQFCKREFLPLNVNNALIFTVSQRTLEAGQVDTLFYGVQSLDAPETVDEFKFHMGFRAKPVRQRVVFHPRLVGLAKEPAHQIVKALSGWFPSSRSLSKAEGMLRFYREGLPT